MFRVSDKVVCVNDSPRRNPRHAGNPSGLSKGSIYVISGFNYRGDILLVGHSTGLKCVGAPGEVGWSHDRFRKLEEIKEENRSKQEQVHYDLCRS